MTLAQKIDALRHAGFPIRYADRTGDRCPQYVNWSDVNDSPHSYHGCAVRAYVDLSTIGKGEDTADQATTLDRSNYRRLREDYPDTFTDISYVNVDTLGAYIGNVSDDLIGMLSGLRNDYPVYDEEDMSALEFSEITEQWADFAADELGRELPNGILRSCWREITADERTELFTQACDTAGYYPEHNGIEVLWSYAYKTTLPHIAEHLDRMMWNSDEVISRVRSAGSHFFDADTMRWFGSRLSTLVYPTISGTYFVTSERDSHGAWDCQRRYTVRFADLDGQLHQVSDFGQYASRSGAQRAAQRMQATGDRSAGVEGSDNSESAA